MKNYTVKLLQFNAYWDGFEPVYSADGFKTVGECVEWVSALLENEMNCRVPFFTYYAIVDNEGCELLCEPVEYIQDTRNELKLKDLK